MEFIFSIPRLVIQTNFAPVISMLVLLAFIRTNINFPDHITRYFFYACTAALLLTLSDNMRFITAHMTEPTIYRYISAGCGYILRPLILYLVAILISRKTAENHLKSNFITVRKSVYLMLVKTNNYKSKLYLKNLSKLPTAIYIHHLFLF